MVRQEHLATYLRCMAAELTGTVREDLKTEYSKKIVDSLVFVLMRLIAETEAGRELAVLDADTATIQARLHEPGALDALVAQLRGQNFETKNWLKETAARLNAEMQRADDRVAPPKTERREDARKPDERPEVLREKLSAYLKEKFSELPDDPIIAFFVAPGGQAKRTAVFRLNSNLVLPERLVLRLDMEFSVSGTVITDEYEIIQRVHAMGLPVPEPVLLERDASRLGGQFMLMTEIENAVGAGTYFPEERRYLGHRMSPQFGIEFAGVLARLHGGTMVAGGPDNGMRESLEKLRAEWREMPKPALSVSFDLGLAWMLAHPLPANRPHCLLHGDAGAHNLLTRDGHLAAVLDWELAHMGDPAEDLAQVKMMLLPDVMPWEDFAAAYIAQGGPVAACDPLAIASYSIWTYLKHGVLNARVWEYFTSGRRDDAPAASMAAHFVDRILLYQARALNDALQTVEG